MHFAQHLRCKNADVADIYFTLLDAAGSSPTLILNQNAKSEERGGWAPFQILTSEAEKLNTQSGASFESVRNLVRASNVTVSKVRQFLH